MAPGDIKVAVRGDSLMSTRHDHAKKKAFRSFKSDFVDHFFPTFGPCYIDYDLNPDQLVKAVTRKILDGPESDILIVGVGMNDLLEHVDKNILKAEWPTHLDEDLCALAGAITSKAKTHLALVGGPSDVWKYPSHWDAFVARAYQILMHAGVTMVPIPEVASVMRQMRLSHDLLHFAHDDTTREVFAKAWTFWLQSHAGVRAADPATIAAASWADWGGNSDAGPKKRKFKPEEVEERKFGVRADSLLNTRSQGKKNAWKTFKGGFCESWWETFGPVDVNYDISNAESVRDVITSIQSASSFEVLLVGIGMEDLLKKAWQRNEVKWEWPLHLDKDLVELAAAIKAKASSHLVIVGGPASVWGYPARWDNFIERAHQLLQHAGAVTVPLQDAARVMAQMPLSFDGLHFAHSDENKALFGKTVAGWLMQYAGVKPKDGGRKQLRQ